VWEVKLLQISMRSAATAALTPNRSDVETRSWDERFL
jgi:hypothetical protein